MEFVFIVIVVAGRNGKGRLLHPAADGVVVDIRQYDDFIDACPKGNLYPNVD